MCKFNVYLRMQNTNIISVDGGEVMAEKFHIKRQEYSNRTFRFPVELLEELNTLASNKNLSLNQIVVQCCEYALKNLDDDES